MNQKENSRQKRMGRQDKNSRQNKDNKQKRDNKQEKDNKQRKNNKTKKDNQFKREETKIVVALAGNPNVGKSTVFNQLTGMKQHTGNWTGKTVTNAKGYCTYHEREYELVDIPGCYSLMPHSAEEEVARDFICFGKPDAVVVVCDATCLERNMNLVLQILEVTSDVVICINLMDEAKKKKIKIDLSLLESRLGVPVIGTAARNKQGLEQIFKALEKQQQKQKKCRNCSAIKIEYGERIEELLQEIEKMMDFYFPEILNKRWICARLLDLDSKDEFYHSISSYLDLKPELNRSLEEKPTQSLEEELAQSLEEELARKLEAESTQNLKAEQLSGLEIEVYDKLQMIREKAEELLEEKQMEKKQVSDQIASAFVRQAEKVCSGAISFENKKYHLRDRKLDHIFTSKYTGFPIMFLLLMFIFWLTITGANYPSQLLSRGFFFIESQLVQFFLWIKIPTVLSEAFIFGIYRVSAWVISVMLPPMAIFFPLFTILEDFGYLPRVAFNLDRCFKRCNACGKQALTMCMGFGCNAVGVMGCRIIDSKRERLIAIITNSFVPCNGRFPGMITLISLFFVSGLTGFSSSVLSAFIMALIILIGIFMTLLLSKLLSKTLLKGVPSSFTLELPPYRKPQVAKVIIRSIFDRTLFVLGRAILAAAPAGLIIWLFANITIGDMTILARFSEFLNPFASYLGMDGVILMAFILGLPANEIVIPIIIMAYLAEGKLIELNNLTQLKELFILNGWTFSTAVSVILFSLIHWPCSTTCITIKKETQSNKWLAVSILIPTLIGMLLCFLFTSIVNILGLS